MGVAEKSRLRDQLITLRNVQGPPLQARGRLEGLCMAEKQKKGVPTERELEQTRVAAQSRVHVPAQTPDYHRERRERLLYEQSLERQRRAADRAAAVAAARRAEAAAR